MKHLRVMLVICPVVAALWFWQCFAADSGPLATITDQDRCPVCGMLVGKYPAWVAQIRMPDGQVAMFDGPKDMLAYYFTPDEYGGSDAKVADIVVKDYYTQKWIDGQEALYVIGSDVYGPMGEEFVPFVSREAAENFLKDHHGIRIVTFDEITVDLVQDMRKGHKMKMHRK